MRGWLARLYAHARRLRGELQVLSLAASDPRTPRAARWLIAAAIAYALSPIDLIPDFIPVLGMLDELIVLPLLLALAIRLIPPEVTADCRQRVSAMRDDRLPHGRYAAVAIVAVWILLVVLAACWVSDSLQASAPL